MDQNLFRAMEANPEAFASVDMLYVPVTINGYTFPLLVDTGAQRTIISPTLVETLKISHLIDRRFLGVAQGVGTGNMEGRIHSIDMDIGYMQCDASFVVLDVGSVGGLLGLDWMRKHNVCLDLKRNGLVIPTGFNDDNVFIEFMPEWEVTQMQKNIGLGPLNAPELPKGGEMLGSNIPFVPASIPTPVQPPAAAVTAASSALPLTPDQESKIQTLVDMGFPRSAAKQALTSTNWNIELAGGILFM